MRTESISEQLNQFPDPDGFWKNQTPVEVETTIRQTLPNIEDATASDLKNIFYLCRALGMQNRLDEAKAVLEKCKTLIDQAPAQDQKNFKIKLLIEQGRLCLMGMAPSKAHAFFYDAWLAATKNEEIFFVIETTFLLSLCQSRKNKKAWLQKAINAANSTSNEQAKLWRSHLYLLDGWYSFDLHLYPEAISSFKNALAQPRVEGETSNLNIIKWSLARCYRAVGEYEKAEAILWELNKELKNHGIRNGHVYLEIAECMQLTHKQEEAKQYYEFAYRELSNDVWYANNKVNELNRMKHLYKFNS